MKVVTRITEDSNRESVTIAGLTVSRFARQINGTYAVTLDNVFGGEIVLDQRLTESQVLDFVHAAYTDAAEHGETYDLEVVPA